MRKFLFTEIFQVIRVMVELESQLLMSSARSQEQLQN